MLSKIFLPIFRFSQIGKEILTRQKRLLVVSWLLLRIYFRRETALINLITWHVLPSSLISENKSSKRDGM